MSGEPQLYRVEPESRQTDRIQEVDFAQLGIRERHDIQEWIADNPGILDDDLLIINKEFSGFDRTNERLDLLAVDADGKLVIIELKRDDTGADAHWQAIKYASYFQRATVDEIVGLAATYWSESRDAAVSRLTQHLGADDLKGLNNDQRIVLASHRFAPEVTSAALWLNQQVHGEDMVTCVKLTPHQDTYTGTLYVQASTIIPVPGADEYLVGIGQSSTRESARVSSFATNLGATFARNKNDEVSQFVKRVGTLAIGELPDGIRPDRLGRWAGQGGGGSRYYHLWYSDAPWGNWKVNYSIDLLPQEDSEEWEANISFENRQKLPLPAFDGTVQDIQRDENQHGIFYYIAIGPDILNDEFANQVAEILRKFIVAITPLVDDFGNEAGEEDEP